MITIVRRAAALAAAAVSALLLCAGVSAYEYEPDFSDSYVYEYCEDLSEGQINIMKRARQMLEVRWTPLYDRYQWGYTGVFRAGSTYTGIPYGQPVNAAYVGYAASISDFVAAAENGNSRLYTDYSLYNQTAPYYSNDCSSFVSYAWGIKGRKTTYSLVSVGKLISETSIDALEVGDCLNDLANHTVIVGGVLRDGEGNVTTVEIMEQTPPIAKRTVYGDGGTKSLDYLVSYYFDRGYRIYRNPNRNNVRYVHDCAVPIDDDYCSKCRDAAPVISVRGKGRERLVTITAEGDEIYYTVDGTDPERNGTVYDGVITVKDSASIRAVAYGGKLGVSRVSSMTVTVEQTKAPEYKQLSGQSGGGKVSYGSRIQLGSKSAGAAIYYTTDGSVPDETSRLYSEPIKITADTTIKAIALADGCRESEVSSFAFSIGRFSSFNDVPDSAWYANAVDFAAVTGLFNGTGSGGFSPDSSMTRGMFITVLGRMAGVEPSNAERLGVVTGDDVNVRSGPGTENERVGSVSSGRTVNVIGEENGWYSVSYGSVTGYIREDFLRVYSGEFTDVSDNAYYSAYAKWAYAAGITGELDGGLFAPDEDVSRQDMAVMLYNYAVYRGESIPEVNERAYFSDDAMIEDSAKEAVYALQCGGIISGMGDGAFSPSGSATRAQVAQIFMKFLLR